jgi:histidyl-tRNA synthetase
VKLDLSIVRGLAYYTGIVFELFDRKGEFRAICGGGRYDTLLQSLGGSDMPALGFGLGDVVLSELLKARGLMPAGTPEVAVWVAPMSPEHSVAALTAATALRLAGITVEMPLRAQTAGKQIKAARAAGARIVVFVDDAYSARGEFRAESLATHAGSTYSSISDFVHALSDTNTAFGAVATSPEDASRPSRSLPPAP